MRVHEVPHGVGPEVSHATVPQNRFF